MDRPPLPPFTDESAAKKARLAEDAWNSRDPARVALAYTEDSRWRNRAEFFQGREAITQAAQGFMTAFPDLVVMMDNLLDHGDKVIYQWTLTGANTGPGEPESRFESAALKNGSLAPMGWSPDLRGTSTRWNTSVKSSMG